jgi:hypothetical protein
MLTQGLSHWLRVPGLQDQDAMLSNPEQQLVCLLEHWGVPPAGAANNTTARLWIATDPDAYHNYMTHATGQRVLNWNTGGPCWQGNQAV